MEVLKNARSFPPSGGAVITKRPTNQTVQEGQGVEMVCEGQANPRNVSVRWYKDGKDIKTLAELVRGKKKDGQKFF